MPSQSFLLIVLCCALAMRNYLPPGAAASSPSPSLVSRGRAAFVPARRQMWSSRSIGGVVVVPRASFHSSAVSSAALIHFPPPVLKAVVAGGGVMSVESEEGADREEKDSDEDRGGRGGDDDGASSESGTLRQITFLGLTKRPDGVDSGDGGGAEVDARNLSDFLMEIGACSVSLTDSDADTPDEDPAFHEPSTIGSSFSGDSNDSLSMQWMVVCGDAAVGQNLWKRCDVSAHFAPSSFDAASIIDAVTYTFAFLTTPRYIIDEISDRDWVRHVQESWTPIVTGGRSRFVLRFPWHDDAAVMRACQDSERERMQEEMARKFSTGVKREGAVVHFEDYGDSGGGAGKAVVATARPKEYVQIKLEGGVAFGTGEHPTTRMCLGWVRDAMERRLDERREEEGGISSSSSLNFLDYGAGSGVLGIAAVMVAREHDREQSRQSSNTSSGGRLLRQETTVVGIDIDADAIRVADFNAERNGVEMKNYLPDPEALSDDPEAKSVVLRVAARADKRDVFLPDEMNRPIYDLCAANILARPLVGLAPIIASLVRPGGEIGLSGVLSQQAESVTDAYEEFFDGVEVAAQEGGWVLITGTRR